ncbi:hypothetical protein HDU84_000166 [Entophlyctis sp. JEL0112]|nr:hypothetical protein HDU84_000166 [Entophlyctis sp. JEL0112]
MSSKIERFEEQVRPRILLIDLFISRVDAIRAMQEAQIESVTHLKKIQELQEELKEKENQIAENSFRLLEDFQMFLDVIEVSIRKSGENSILNQLPNYLKETTWNRFLQISRLHRPDILLELDQTETLSENSRFPVISTKNIPNSNIRVASAVEPRAKRRSAKMTFFGVSKAENGSNSEEVAKVELALEKSKFTTVRLQEELENLNEERRIQDEMLNIKSIQIESLQQKIDHFEALEKARDRVKAELCDVSLQTDDKSRPFASLSTSELIKKLTSRDISLAAEEGGHIQSQQRIDGKEQREESSNEQYFVHQSVASLESDGDTDSAIDETAPQQTNKQLLADLHSAMKAKADLQRELTVKNRETEKLKHSHAEKLIRMEKDIEALNRDLLRAQAEVSEALGAKEKIRDESEKKIKSLEMHLTKLKSRLKDLEKISKDKEVAERKVSENQLEIDKLNSALSNYKRKAKDESERVSDLESRKMKDTSALTRARDEDAKKIRQLETAIENFRKKLDRKEEECTALVKKLKDGIAIDRVNKTSKQKPVAKSSANDQMTSEVQNSDYGVNPPGGISAKFCSISDQAAQIERYREYHAISLKIRDIKNRIDKFSLAILQEDEADAEESKSKSQTLKQDRRLLGRELVELRHQRNEIEKLLEQPDREFHTETEKEESLSKRLNDPLESELRSKLSPAAKVCPEEDRFEIIE